MQTVRIGIRKEDHPLQSSGTLSSRLPMKTFAFDRRDVLIRPEGKDSGHTLSRCLGGLPMV